MVETGQTIIKIAEGFTVRRRVIGGQRPIQIPKVFLEKGFKETYPKTNFHYVKKSTFMAQKDPALWAEMQEKADAMVIALGH